MTTRRTFLRLLGIGAPAAAVATQLPETATAAPSEINNAVRGRFDTVMPDGYIEEWEEPFDLKWGEWLPIGSDWNVPEGQSWTIVGPACGIIFRQILHGKHQKHKYAHVSILHPDKRGKPWLD